MHTILLLSGYKDIYSTPNVAGYFSLVCVWGGGGGGGG